MQHKSRPIITASFSLVFIECSCFHKRIPESKCTIINSDPNHTEFGLVRAFFCSHVKYMTFDLTP
jgi:hypothetical protein